MKRTTGKGFYRWLKEQKDVIRPSKMGGHLFYLTYNGVRCVGLVGKTYSNGRLSIVNATIRPISAMDTIAGKAGDSIYMTFEEDANKKPPSHQPPQ